jgi:hypothetical protein
MLKLLRADMRAQLVFETLAGKQQQLMVSARALQQQQQQRQPRCVAPTDAPSPRSWRRSSLR